MNGDFYTGVMGAAPTLLIAWVIEYRYLLARKANLFWRILGFLIVLALNTAFLMSASQLFYGVEPNTESTPRIILLLMIFSASAMAGLFLVTFMLSAEDHAVREGNV